MLLIFIFFLHWLLYCPPIRSASGEGSLSFHWLHAVQESSGVPMRSESCWAPIISKSRWAPVVSKSRWAPISSESRWAPSLPEYGSVNVSSDCLPARCLESLSDWLNSTPLSRRIKVEKITGSEQEDRLSDGIDWWHPRFQDKAYSKMNSLLWAFLRFPLRAFWLQLLPGFSALRYKVYLHHLLLQRGRMRKHDFKAKLEQFKQLHPLTLASSNLLFRIVAAGCLISYFYRSKVEKCAKNPYIMWNFKKVQNNEHSISFSPAINGKPLLENFFPELHCSSSCQGPVSFIDNANSQSFIILTVGGGRVKFELPYLTIAPYIILAGSDHQEANSLYSFISHAPLSVANTILNKDPNAIICRISVSTLASYMNYRQAKAIANTHNLRVRSDATAASIVEILQKHTWCPASCYDNVFVFSPKKFKKCSKESSFGLKSTVVE